MSTEFQIPAQPEEPPMIAAGPVQQKPKRKFAIVVIIAAALLLGGAVGAAAKPPEEKIITETKTVTEYRTPAACTEGFDLAEQVFASSSTAMGYMSDAMQAAGRLDLATIKAAPAKIDVETRNVQNIAPKYRAAKEACLAK